MMSNSGPWIWYSEACPICGTAITCSKTPIAVAREEGMLKELRYYMTTHVRTKHREVTSFTYTPHPTLHPRPVGERIGQ